MACGIIFLYLLKVVTLLLSLGTLGCHVAQLVLLNQESGTGSWWPDFIPYILYYAGPIVSILSVFILLFLGCLQSKSLISDRILSIINLLLFIGIVVYNSLQSGTIPWTGSLKKEFSSSAKGYVSYCSNYEDNRTSMRCWLVNGTWLGMIVVGFFWLIIAIYTLVQRNSDMYKEDYDVYDYKEDAPMAKRTPSIIKSDQTFPSPAKNQLHKSYISPVVPPHHHQSYTPPVQNNGYYYHHQQPQMYDTSNDYNNDYYLNPVQEEYLNNTHVGHQQHDLLVNNTHVGYQQHDLPVNDTGYERARKVSKTLIDNGSHFSANHSNISPSESVQPPHSYDGLVRN